MKVYKFFRISDEYIQNLPGYDSWNIQSKYPLYAFTNNKSLAKRFEKERKKNLFIKVINNMSREEYANFAMNNRGNDLKIQRLLSVTDKDTKKQKIIQIEVLLTQNEYVNCNEPFSPVYDEGWWGYILSTFYTDPYVFNEDLRQALRILDYTITYKLHRDSSSFDFIEEEDDDYEAPDWLNDELQYFVEMYQDTFK